MLYYVNNENLYSSNKRIIKKDKDKDNLEESKPEREKTWSNIDKLLNYMLFIRITPSFTYITARIRLSLPPSKFIVIIKLRKQLQYMKYIINYIKKKENIK